jgi:hypothetical protein
LGLVAPQVEPAADCSGAQISVESVSRGLQVLLREPRRVQLPESAPRQQRAQGPERVLRPESRARQQGQEQEQLQRARLAQHRRWQLWLLERPALSDQAGADAVRPGLQRIYLLPQPALALVWPWEQGLRLQASWVRQVSLQAWVERCCDATQLR